MINKLLTFLGTTVGFSALLLVTPSTTVGNFPVYNQYQNQYQTNYVKEIITPVAVAVPTPVLVPAFQYQYSPPPPVAAAPGETATAAKSDIDEDTIKKIARAILSEMNDQANGDGPPTAVGANVQEVDELVSVRHKTARAERADPRVVNILSKNCAACHTGASAKGRFKIFDGPGVLTKVADKRRIWERSDDMTMPPEAARNPKVAVADADMEILRKWASTR